MKNMRLVASVILLLTVGSSLAENATSAQYLYMVNKVLPEVKKAAVFMPPELVEAEKSKLQRAAAAFQIQVTIYPIESNRTIGENLKKVSDDEVLIVYDSPVLMEKSSRLYILKKCKERNIPVITSNEEYSKSGAFIGIIVDGEFKISQLLVNLQHYEQFASKFTEEFSLALGVTQIIR